MTVKHENVMTSCSWVLDTGLKRLHLSDAMHGYSRVAPVQELKQALLLALGGILP